MYVQVAGRYMSLNLIEAEIIGLLRFEAFQQGMP